MLSPGALVAGRYRLDERLAIGGMGEVWRATDVSLGRTVAVKVLLPALLADPKFSTRFRAEARMLAALRHPGVVRVFDYGESKNAEGGHITYLVMQYIEGEPLSRRLEQRGRLSVQETMGIVAQVAAALHTAHTAGIVHRDVKPSNLLLRPDDSVMLVDFGVARSTVATTGITSTNAIIGTAMYMAPEQASGRPVSAATDIYALGAVAHHCLAGAAPFTGSTPLEIALRHVTDDPPELPAEVPEQVRDLVRRALAKEPADRYPTAASLARAARRGGRAGSDGTAGASGTATAARTLPVRLSVPGRPAPANQSPGATTKTDDMPFADDSPRNWLSMRVTIATTAATVLLALAGLAVVAMLSGRGNTPSGGETVPSSQPPSSTSSPTPTVPAAGPVTRRSPKAVRTGRSGQTSQTRSTPAPSSTASSASTSPSSSPLPTASTSQPSISSSAPLPE